MGIPRFIRVLARPAAMAAIWLTATGFFGMAYFVSGGRRVRVEDAVAFTVAFGIAAAVSAVTALAIAARRRFVLEAALPITVLVAMLVGVTWVFSWLAPMMGWGIGSGRNFSGYGGAVPATILGAAREAIPTGSILGVGIGAVMGFVILLARYRPRLVLAFVVALLLFCVVGSWHIVAFDRLVHFVVQSRLAGVNRFEANWTLRSKLASAIGASAGAFVGALIVYGGVRLTDSSRAVRQDADNSPMIRSPLIP